MNKIYGIFCNKTTTSKTSKYLVVKTSKFERSYCILMFLSVFFYSIYLESDWIDPQGNTFNFLPWIFIFIFFYLISSCLILIRIVQKIFFSKKCPPLKWHIAYVSLITFSVFMPNVANYPKRYIQSFYYARDSAECHNEIQRTNHAAVCYAFASYPVFKFIVIDPEGELTKPREMWNETTIQHFLSLGFPENSIVDCQPLITYRFYGDVYLLQINCE